jgi:hypothetical protein
MDLSRSDTQPRNGKLAFVPETPESSMTYYQIGIRRGTTAAFNTTRVGGTEIEGRSFKLVWQKKGEARAASRT